MKEQESIIYGVRTGDTYHYIGKTDKKNVKENGYINKSDINILYNKESLNKLVVGNENITIDQLKSINGYWYDEKLVEVLNKHKDQHPLLNAQWMLDGKRGSWSDTQGYWIGKTRDANTLNRLSESKHIKVLEYNINGEFIRSWKSIKEVATVVIKDYQIINGSGDSKLYGVMSSPYFKSRLLMSSYWFRETELLKHFNCTPKKMNMEKIFEIQKQKKKQSSKLRTQNIWENMYAVIHYNPDGTIKAKYDSTKDAAYQLKTTTTVIGRFCRGNYVDDNYILKYGEKTKQPRYKEYPKYDAQPLNRIVQTNYYKA